MLTFSRLGCLIFNRNQKLKHVSASARPKAKGAREPEVLRKRHGSAALHDADARTRAHGEEEALERKGPMPCGAARGTLLGSAGTPRPTLGESELHVITLAYDLKRVFNLMSMPKLMEAAIARLLSAAAL